MGASVRPPAADDPLADYDPTWRRAGRSAPAAGDPLADYHPGWREPGAAAPAGPAEGAPGVLARYGTAVRQMVAHPLDTVAGFVRAPYEQARDAFARPVIGTPAGRGMGTVSPREVQQLERQLGQRLPRVTRNTPDAITPAQSLRATAQTALNVAAPGVFRGASAVLGPALGGVAAGGAIGAAQSPDDPLVGLLLGGTVAGALHTAPRAAGAAARAVLPDLGPAVAQGFGDVAAAARGTSPLESWVTGRSTPRPGTAAALAMARADALAAGQASTVGARSLTTPAEVTLPSVRVTRPLPPSSRPALVEAPPIIGGRGQRSAAETELGAIRTTLADLRAPRTAAEAGGDAPSSDVPGLVDATGAPLSALPRRAGADRRTFNAVGTTARALPETGGARRRPAAELPDPPLAADGAPSAPAAALRDDPTVAAGLGRPTAPSLQTGSVRMGSPAEGDLLAPFSTEPPARVPDALRPLASASPDGVQLRAGVARRVARDLDARPALPAPTAADLDPRTGVLAQAEAPAPLPPKVRPEFRAAHTDDLLSRLADEQHRLETEANDPSRGGFVRQTDVGEVVSGGTFRGGRMERSAKVTAARIQELEVELRRRGLDEDTIGEARLSGYERAVEGGAAGGRVLADAGADPFGVGAPGPAADDFNPAFLGEAAPAHAAAPARAGRATSVDGTPSNGTPSNGTPSNGTPSNGTPSNGTPGSDVLADYHPDWRTTPAAERTGGPARPDLAPATDAAVNWRTWLDGDAPGGRTVLARVQARAAAIEPELLAAKGYQSRVAQAVEAHAFARDLVADPLTIDRAKVARLTGPQVVALKGVVADNTAVIEAASRALAAGDLAPAEAAHAETVITAAQRATDDALGLVVRESARMGRDLGALRQLARQSVDPDVWLVHAKRMVGDRPLPDAVMVEVRRLARAAADACGGA